MAIQDFSGNDPSYNMGAGSQIAQFLSSIPGLAQKQAQQQSQDTQDQVKLYSELRTQGYTKEDAADRVNRTYRSTNFIQNLLDGNGNNAFEPGTDPDQVDAERAKASSEAGAKLADETAKKAEAAKFLAQASYYQNGGPSGKYAHNDNLTPNQIQMRIKDLRGQVGMGTPEEDTDINGELGYLNNLFNKKSGYKTGGQPSTDDGSKTPAAASAGKYKAGQTVYYKGKPVTIKKINDDGSYEI